MIAALLLSLAIAQTETSTPAQTFTSTPARSHSNEFVKGELANAGSIRLVPRESFIGARLGFLLQDTTLFMSIAPKADLLFLEKKLRISIEIPLNLELYSAANAADGGSGKKGFDDFGRLREQDYDDARDYVKILRAFTYGKKEDPFYFNVGQLHATTIGHGQAMRRYTANLDLDSTKVGAELDAYGGYGGFELTVGDITRGNLFGALVFIKPAALFTENELAKSFSIGAHWTSDQKAPLRLQRGALVGTATAGPVLLDEYDTPLADTRAVNIIGFDSELKVYRTDSTDLKTYADFSMLGGGGNGLTLGMLGRFNFRGEKSLQLLRTRVELRTYDPDFQPSYFDTLYEFQKYQFISDADNESPIAPTKLDYIKNRGGSRRFGLYLEASYSLVDWFVVAAAIEVASGGDDSNLMLHAEVPLEFLDLFVTYQQRQVDRLFSFDINDVLFAGARLQLLPILFVNGSVQKNFVWDRAKFAGLGGYEEQLSWHVDVEAGFEF